MTTQGDQPSCALVWTMTMEAALRQRTPLDYVASAEQCATMAAHFGWVSVDRLTAGLTLSGSAADLLVDGRVRADVTQACVATARPMRERVDAPVSLRLVPADRLEVSAEDEERELDAAAMDILGHDGQTIELGAIIADTLALAVAPWPRSADADAWLAKNPLGDSATAGPFAALAALRPKPEA